MKDCVVVGGGLIGMLSARELALSGVQVTIVERGQAGQESSWAGGGILSPLYPWRYPAAVTQLAQSGQAGYQALAEALFEQTGIESEWQQSGLLMLDVAEHDEAVAWAQRNDVVLERLENDEIQRCEPSIQGFQRTAWWMPEVAQIRNPRLLIALRHSLQLLGVVFEEQAAVVSLQQKGGRVTGVETITGIHQAENVVIASGAWSRDLLAGVGCSIEVEPVRGQMLLYKGSPGLLHTIVMQDGHYVIPRRDGHVLVGSTVEYVGFDKSTTESAANALRQVAEQLVPALGAIEVVRHWAGLRPGSVEGVPYIGAHPEIAGLFVNTGHFRNGVVLGPGSAQLLADVMLGRTSGINESLYAIER